MTWIAIGLGAILIVLVIQMTRTNKRLEQTIASQQDTIQRLVNREPVTYTEVGQDAPQPAREFYSAWGGETIDAKDVE